MAGARDSIQAAAALAPLLQGILTPPTANQRIVVSEKTIRREKGTRETDGGEAAEKGSEENVIYQVRESRLGHCLTFVTSFCTFLAILIYLLVEYFGRENVMTLLTVLASCNGTHA